LLWKNWTLVSTHMQLPLAASWDICIRRQVLASFSITRKLFRLSRERKFHCGRETVHRQVTFETRIIDVLEMFISLDVPAVPVVDEDTSHLADIFCKSDVIVSSISLLSFFYIELFFPSQILYV